MTYSQFTRELEYSLKQISGIPENIIFTQSTKNNGVVTQNVCIRDSNVTIAPSIGLDYFYGEYLKGRNIDDIAEKISEIYFSQPDFSSTQFNLTWKNIKEHVVYHLVSYDSNRGLIEKAPHIRLLNLSLIFKIRTDYLGISGYITINNSILNLLDVDLKTLTETAIKNTPLQLPLSFKKMQDTLKEIPEYSDSECCLPDSISLWICTNKEKLFGASCIFYNDLTKQLSESYLSDCYVLPSSVHEILLLKKCPDITLSALEEMVVQVNNSDFVSDTDFLSNSVYTYPEIKKAYDTALEDLNIMH